MGDSIRDSSIFITVHTVRFGVLNYNSWSCIHLKIKIQHLYEQAHEKDYNFRGIKSYVFYQQLAAKFEVPGLMH